MRKKKILSMEKPSFTITHRHTHTETDTIKATGHDHCWGNGAAYATVVTSCALFLFLSALNMMILPVFSECVFVCVWEKAPTYISCLSINDKWPIIAAVFQEHIKK